MPPVEEVLLGIYIGTLTGVFAAAIVYALTFLFTYLAGAKLSINYALLIGLGIAGLAGGPRLLLRNPEILQSSTSLVMLVLVLFLSFYAHRSATDLGEALPPTSVALRKLRSRSLSAGVVEHVGRYGQVTIRPTGEVEDLEGYPPVSDDVRAEIRADRWRFPADLPVAEIESRLADRLRTDYDLADAAVAIDSSGRATIRVAPTLGGLSRRVPSDTQVVSVETVLPGGLAPGDDVVLELPACSVDGRVVGVAADGGRRHHEELDLDGERDADEAEPSPGAPLPRPDALRVGGVGRVAVAVDPDDVGAVVAGDLGNLYVRSHGRLPVFEFVSRLRRHDLRFKKLTVGPDSPLVGVPLGDLDLRDAYDVVVLAVKSGDRWRFAPDRTATVARGDELYVSGPKDGLAAFREAVE